MKNTFTNLAWKCCMVLFLAVLSVNSNAQNASVSISPAGPVICEGDQITANATGLTGPLTYTWSTGETTQSITPAYSGYYRVRVTGLNSNGVTRTVSTALLPYIVVKHPNPIFVKGPSNLCPGQSVELVAKGRKNYSSYLWNTGATTPKITVNQSGTYALTITNALGGCSFSGTATTDINVYDSGYQPAVTGITPLTVCQPGWVTLGADPGFSSYSWSTGSTSQNTSVLMDGSGGGPILDTLTVYLTVGVNNACSFTSAGTVIRSVRETELLPAYCNNYALTMNDSIKSGIILTYITAPVYEFQFEETTQPNITWTYQSTSRWCNLSAVTPALQANKFYNVRVRGIIDGTPYCYGDLCQIGIIGSLRPASTTLSNALRADGTSAEAQIFPNPSNDAFNMYLRNIDTSIPATVTVADVQGRLVDQFSYDGNNGIAKFGESLNNGVYFVTVEQGTFKNVTRIVKTK
jgi:hypothetical protein